MLKVQPFALIFKLCYGKIGMEHIDVLEDEIVYPERVSKGVNK